MKSEDVEINMDDYLEGIWEKLCANFGQKLPELVHAFRNNSFPPFFIGLNKHLLMNFILSG